MLFDDICYRCEHRLPDGHPEHEKAKAFWRKHGDSYVYDCGGYYHPFPHGHGVEFHKGRYCKFSGGNEAHVAEVVAQLRRMGAEMKAIKSSVPVPGLDLFYCEMCGQYYSEDQMVIYECLPYRTGKCRECVRELERQRLGVNVIRCENSLANSKNV